MDNSRYDAIMREYDSIRYRNHFTQDERKKEIYEKFPEIAAFDKEISETSIAALSTSLSVSDAEYKTLKKELDVKLSRLEMQKKDFLKSHGYPKNYLEPLYNCEFCKDTGYVNGKKCTCFRQMAAKLFMQDDKVRAMPLKANFKNFRLDIYRDTPLPDGRSPRDRAEYALSKSLAFVDNFNQTRANLLISGSTGTGKTFLAGCIAHELIEAGYSLAFVTAFNFFDILQKNTFHRKETDESDLSLADYFLDCDLLILDDLGTEFINTFTIGRLFTYINERLVRRKSTIISTNYTMKDIRAAYSERVFSRLAGSYEMISLTGGDLRTSC